MLGESRGGPAGPADRLMLASIAFLLILSIIFFFMPSIVLLPLSG